MAVLLLCSSGCGKMFSKTYHVAIDPSFFPMNFRERESSVLAFCNELLSMVSKEANLNFVRINMSWDSINDGLRKNRYQAMLSCMSPNLINLTTYDFSDAVLRTGAVLVLPKKSSFHALTDLKGQLVAIDQTNSQIDFLTKYPKVDFTFYTSLTDALEKTSRGQYQGSLIPVIPAMAYVHDLYHESLTIASRPLTNDAIRLVTLHDQHSELQDMFNNALTKLIDSGEYHNLAKRWNLVTDFH